MLRAFLIGLVGGARAMTPLAVVANAARTGTLPADNGALRILSHPLVSLSATAAATYELAGDKQKTAPNRTIPPAVVIRSLNAALAGMALSSRKERFAAAAVAGATAALSAYATFALRMIAMRRGSQMVTGLVEDAIVVGAGIAAARATLPEVREPTRALSHG